MTGFVLATHLLTATVAITLPIVWPLRGILALLVLSSLGWLIWSQILGRAPWSIREAVWDEHGWRLTLADGRTREARLMPSTYVGVGLVILNFRIGPIRHRALVLTADTIDPDMLRRLRARLRLAGSLGSTVGDNGL